MKRVVCAKCNKGFEVIDGVVAQDIQCPACRSIVSDEGTETAITDFGLDDLLTLREELTDGDEPNTREEEYNPLRDEVPPTAEDDDDGGKVVTLSVEQQRLISTFVVEALVLHTGFFRDVLAGLKADADFVEEVTGDDGKDADVNAVAEALKPAIEKKVGDFLNALDKPKAGKDGKDADVTAVAVALKPGIDKMVGDYLVANNAVLARTVTAALTTDDAFKKAVRGNDGKSVTSAEVTTALKADPAFMASVKAAITAEAKQFVAAHLNANRELFRGDPAPANVVESAVQAEVRRILAADPDRFRSQHQGPPGEDASPRIVADLLAHDDEFVRKTKGATGNHGADAMMWPGWVGMLIAVIAIVTVFMRTKTPSSPPPDEPPPAGQHRTDSPSADRDPPAPQPQPQPEPAPKKDEPNPDEPAQPAPAESDSAPPPAAPSGLPTCDACMATCKADSVPMVPSVFTKEEVDAMCAMDTPTSVCRKGTADATCQ